MSKFRKKQYHNISYQFYWRSVSIKVMLTQHSACWPSLHLRFSLPFSFSLSLSLSVALAPMSESVIKMIRVTVRVAISCYIMILRLLMCAYLKLLHHPACQYWYLFFPENNKEHLPPTSSLAWQTIFLCDSLDGINQKLWTNGHGDRSTKEQEHLRLTAKYFLKTKNRES